MKIREGEDKGGPSETQDETGLKWDIRKMGTRKNVNWWDIAELS